MRKLIDWLLIIPASVLTKLLREAVTLSWE